MGCRRAFSGNEAHSDAQTKQKKNRETAHFVEQCLVARAAECPLAARIGYTWWFYDGDSLKPGAMGANRAAGGDSSSRFTRVISLSYDGWLAAVHGVFHCSPSFLSSCFSIFHFVKQTCCQSKISLCFDSTTFFLISP